MVLDSRREDGQTQQKENPTPLTSLYVMSLYVRVSIYTNKQ
jgi:hypothetical protein